MRSKWLRTSRPKCALQSWEGSVMPRSAMRALRETPRDRARAARASIRLAFGIRHERSGQVRRLNAPFPEVGRQRRRQMGKVRRQGAPSGAVATDVAHDSSIGATFQARRTLPVFWYTRRTDKIGSSDARASLRLGDIAVATGIAYPHIDKQEDQPARLERLPRIRVAQIVMDYLA